MDTARAAADPSTVTSAEPAEPAEPTCLCAVCATAVPTSAAALAVGQALCATCADRLEHELDAERAPPRYLQATLAGLAGALAGAAVWATIAVTLDVEVGYIAVLVGFLAGVGVKLGAGKSRSRSLQMFAAGLAVFGLVAAKYGTVAAVAAREIGLSPFDPVIFELFQAVIGETSSPFDALWLFLAVGAAYKVPAPSNVTIVR